MEPSAAQTDDEEELMDIVAARSRGDNREAELRKLEMFESEAQQRVDERAKREEIGFQSSQHHPSTTGDISTGEEKKEDDDSIILKPVQDQINIHQQVTSETLSAEASLKDELAIPQRMTCGQNQSYTATMHPGAYAVAPGNAMNQSTTDIQTTTPTNTNSGLAVANPVDENEEPAQIAIPGHFHRENRSTSMTLMILVLVGSILIVGVIDGSICGAGLCSNKDGDVETQALTSFRYFVLEDIQNRIEEEFGPDYFPKNEEPEPTQPKFEALDWIVFEDPLQLNPDANNLLQRFIVVLTYFQTSQESDWLDCGPSTTGNDDTCWIQTQGLESLESRWLEGVHECQWAGIWCDREKNVTQLLLMDNGLNGPLPTELASLPALESIEMDGNQLTGTVPSIYGSLVSLSSLYLSHNQLSGTIPVELFGTNLSTIYFFNNSLTGTVPTEVGLFDGTWLGFGSNSLSGSIPTEVFQVGKGTQLRVEFQHNLLTGTLPTEIGAWHGSYVFDIFLGWNPLHGTIPSEIGLLKGNIGVLDISWTNMDGSLPEELFIECNNLAGLRVSNCGLTGTISTGLQLLTQLHTFDISRNKFHGTIPAQLSALTKLHRFIVNGNDLSGSIPSSVCTLADPTKAYFDVVADCMPRGGTGKPMVDANSRRRRLEEEDESAQDLQCIGWVWTRLRLSATRNLYSSAIDDVELIREYFSEGVGNGGLRDGMSQLDDLERVWIGKPYLCTSCGFLYGA
ncbi:leucine Rich Repeat [Seminavis robusta]|uniref:Leucine Rich Repeat n=1 Tax=Seminavis robusta TaxID=568900 RepID=A0A9N8EKS3_9STRA|nr:leucine Rich Repeat [Seminavis robusta]|eukprot:Sro1312_g261850.1 leucine Rich Repeat (738) ;mRNA; r:23859-26473